MRLGILVSGRGSNLRAVLLAVKAGQLPLIEPVVVISNRHAIGALAIAHEHAVPALVLAGRDFVDLGARDAAIGRALNGARCDLHLYQGQSHGFFNKGKYTETVIEADKFLVSLGYLKGEPTLRPPAAGNELTPAPKK